MHYNYGVRILVTGGCGYIGTVLVPLLLREKHQVKVIDTQWFGNHLNSHPNLEILKNDFREIESLKLGSIDTVIHLANVANDPSVELNQELSWDINVLGIFTLLKWSEKRGIKDFIYLSSGSVYGVSEEPNVTEESELKPISTYNKTKMIAEQVLFNFREKFRTISLRPATVCGYSPQMRFDVVVNMLTQQALENQEIIVLGGSQTRPNVHIRDLVAVIMKILSDSSITSGSYNVGFQNLDVSTIAQIISERIPCRILYQKSIDPRSYKLDSSKIMAYGFEPKFNVEFAIEELCKVYSEGKTRNLVHCNRVKAMIELGMGKIEARS